MSIQRQREEKKQLRLIESDKRSDELNVFMRTLYRATNAKSGFNGTY